MKPQSVVLKEQTVLERTKAESLSAVRNLNLWGEGFTDVSIVGRIPGIEVLALAANHLTTLRYFAPCTSLRELYLRKNDIRSLSEIKYIKDLPNLRTLWLMDNPCAKNSFYRSFVILCCPHLRQLDNIEVTEREREEAKRSLSEKAVQDILATGTLNGADAENKPQPLDPPPAAKNALKRPPVIVTRRSGRDEKEKEKEKEEKEEERELQRSISKDDGSGKEPSYAGTPSDVSYTTVQTQRSILTAIVSLLPELTLGSLDMLEKEIREEVMRREKSVRSHPKGSQ